MSGLFATFEGVEGAGKSTLIKRVSEALRAEGRPTQVTREPGDGEVGGRIRSILLEGGELTHLAEVFLFLADRHQHVTTMVKPALARGEIVLCDRYADSTVVYQGYARGLEVETLRSWNQTATEGLAPDVTFLLDLDPEVGLRRQTKGDRMDREPLAFHQSVRSGFLSEAARDPRRWVVMDATQSPDEVFGQCMAELLRRLA